MQNRTAVLTSCIDTCVGVIVRKLKMRSREEEEREMGLVFPCPWFWTRQVGGGCVQSGSSRVGGVSILLVGEWESGRVGYSG